MSDNSQKLWLGGSANRVAQRHVNDAIAQLGYALPCSVVSVAGSIVTVKFEVNASPFTLPQITVPVFGPEYIRYPIQAGCQGVCYPASVGIGNVTGLGPAAAPRMTRPGNLSALVFFPVGNKNFSPTDDPNALVLYGPDGVIIRDAGKKTTITLTVNGVTISLQATDAVTIEGNAIITGNLQLGGALQSVAGHTYTGNLEVAGNVIAGFGTADEVTLQGHKHKQGADSHGDTEQDVDAPTPGT